LTKFCNRIAREYAMHLLFCYRSLCLHRFAFFLVIILFQIINLMIKREEKRANQSPQDQNNHYITYLAKALHTFGLPDRTLCLGVMIFKKDNKKNPAVKYIKMHIVGKVIFQRLIF